MKELLISSAAVALLMGTAAAQPPDNEDNHHHGQAQEQQQDNGRGPDRAGGLRNDSRVPTNYSNTNDQSTGGAANSQTMNGNRNVDRPTNTQRNVDVHRNIDVNRNVTVNRDVNVNRNVTVNRTVNTQRNFNIAQFRKNMRAERRFHASRYMAPRGYSYRRWTFGERLPVIYYSQNYWLTDYFDFGLLAPPPGYVWVRYGNDALLIDRFTGEIIQVRYDVFWS